MRRVMDKVTKALGWAVEEFPGHRWRVEWDEPTPYQDSARPKVPGRFIEWAP